MNEKKLVVAVRDTKTVFHSVNDESIRLAQYSSSWVLDNAKNLDAVSAGKLAVAISENAQLESIRIVGCRADAHTIVNCFCDFGRVRSRVVFHSISFGCVLDGGALLGYYYVQIPV